MQLDLLPLILASLGDIIYLQPASFAQAFNSGCLRYPDAVYALVTAGFAEILTRSPHKSPQNDFFITFCLTEAGVSLLLEMLDLTTAYTLDVQMMH